jgi:hypothetical protein
VREPIKLNTWTFEYPTKQCELHPQPNSKISSYVWVRELTVLEFELLTTPTLDYFIWTCVGPKPNFGVELGLLWLEFGPFAQ